MESPTTTLPVRVAIAYHTGRQHTGRIAESVAAGAAADNTVVDLVQVDTMDRTSWAALDKADAIIFGTPTYMASASAAFHTFAEASSRRWLSQAWRDKIAAGFTNSGSKAGDKSSTLGYLATLAAQHGMIWVGLGLLPGWNTSKGSESDLNRLGFHVGAATQSYLDEGADRVHESDLRTAEHLGARVARLTAAFVVGHRATA